MQEFHRLVLCKETVEHESWSLSQKVFRLGAVDTEDLGRFQGLLFFSTHFQILKDYEPLLSKTSLAVLSWCNGCIATLTKLPMRVRFPSTVPQPQVLMTDLLVSIKKLGKLSTGLRETRAPFNLCAQHLGQSHQSLMHPYAPTDAFVKVTSNGHRC